MHYKKCEVCGVRSGRSNGQKRIFMAKFPLDGDRCKKWVKVTGKEDLVYIPIEKLHQLKMICGSHFLPKDFKKKKTQLKKNAIPSVGLTAEPLADELLIGFPLHTKTEQTDLSSVISMEHDYCCSVSSTSTFQPVPVNCSKKDKRCFRAEHEPKRIRLLSPIPSTSNAEPLPIQCFEESKNSTEDLPSSVISAEHDYCCSVPSTSATQPMPKKCSEEDKRFSTAEHEPKRIRLLSPIPSTSNAEPLPIQCFEESKNSTEDLPSSVISAEHDYCCSVPSTSATQPTPKKCSEEDKRFSTADPASSTAGPVPSSSTKNKMCLTTEPSTVAANVILATPRKKKQKATAKQEVSTPRKRKLMFKLRKSKALIKSLRKKVLQIQNISSPVMRSLIESTVKNEKRKAKGRRWSKLNKSVALALYKKSPKAYRYLSQLLSMPSVRSLQIILENMKMEPGVDPVIVKHLKLKAEGLKDEDKICVILFDEIALKSRLIYNVAADKIDGYEDLGEEGGRSEKIADHSLVFMLQGIHCY